jgi:hypothetical protein
METFILFLFALVLIPSTILLWLIVISEMINLKKEKLREKLKEAALKSNEALLDYVYNHFEL